MKRSKKRVARADREPVTSIQALPEAEADADAAPLWQEPFVQMLVILCTGFVVYFNAMAVPFFFDDHDCILKNPAIRDFSAFPDTQRVMNLGVVADVQNNIVLRPVAYFTFAINYALHGYDVFGYHLVNLLLHIGSALLVYCLFSRLLRMNTAPREESMAPEMQADLHYLPFFAALLFVCHPLQTQAVTYIVQRFVPLATCFYLASLVMYLRFRCATGTTERIIAYGGSLVAAVLAMESKEIAFTLPVIMALCEFMFLKGAPGKRVALLIPFFLTMVIIPEKLMHLQSTAPDAAETVSGAINLVNFRGVSSWDYLMSQFGVIITYLRLLALPVGQNLDYDYPLQQHFFSPAVLLPLALLLAIGALGMYLLKRSRENRLYSIIAFGIFWFFITLSVESSVVPIDDLIFEHRAYLPSIGVFMAVLAGGSILVRRLTGKPLGGAWQAYLVIAAVVVAFSAATIARNRVWQNEVAFWTDVTRKSPFKARGYAWLGESYVEEVIAGIPPEVLYENPVPITDVRLESAIKAYQQAVRLRPSHFIYYTKLGEVYLLQKKLDEADAMFLKAEQRAPKNPWSAIYRGDLAMLKGNMIRARQEYEKAIAREPAMPVSRLRLADLDLKEGNIKAAIRELEDVMRLYPDETIRMKLESLKRQLR